MNTLQFLADYQKIAPMNELLLMLSKATGLSNNKLLIQDALKITTEQKKIFKDLIKRYSEGEPLPYLLGEWGFYDLLFTVTPDVLIPRPETEQIIDLITKRFKDRAQELRVLDVGTGSGILPTTIASLYPSANVEATDISPAALQVACSNAIRHDVESRVRFWEADLLPIDLTGSKFDIITANLPYIPTETVKTLEIFGKEPTMALDGGANGTEIIERLLEMIINLRVDFEVLFLEIEYRQGREIQGLGEKYFPTKSTSILQDLVGHDRIAVIEERSD